MYSQDPAVKENNGDLGFITAFSLPYEMETVAYNTAVGKYSMPFKSKVGYHIFKVTADRKALGTMKAAQILLPFLEGGGEDQKAKAALVAKEAYEKYQKGEVFENLARAYSGDMQTAQGGGILRDFTVGKYEASFENAFSALKDEEVSKPFKTAFGWHILKRLGTIPVKTVKDAEAIEQVTALVNNDSRKEKAKEAFTQRILGATQYKAAPIDKALLLQITEEVMNTKEIPTGKAITQGQLLHSFTKQKVTVGNLWQFVKDAKNGGLYPNFTAEQIYNEYVKATAFEYYKAHLEDYNTEFKNQMREFKDGNLLFEAMERNVWNKSANDSLGLRKYYAANTQKYSWDKSADAIILSINDAKVATELYNGLKQNPANWRDLLIKFPNNAQADSGRFELGNIPVAEKTSFSNGLTTMPFSPNNDGNMIFVHVYKLYEPGQKKSFEDAKGLVINDYQIKLEEDWINSLKKKYPVKMNDAVWKDILAKGK
jgi:peptidyl-prolyl cis-trans isomerase SurA